MTCQNYQYLVDRGFQRSGKFVYKPQMKRTCCPQYVIRMDVKKFKLSKSHKSSIRKFKKYLLEGRNTVNAVTDFTKERTPNDGACSSSVVSPASAELGSTSQESDQLPQVTRNACKVRKAVKPGMGPDPEKPPCKKAKILRNERRQKKLLHQMKSQRSNITTSTTSTVTPQGPSNACCQNDIDFCQYLEEVLTFPKGDDCLHKVTTQLVRIGSKEFTESFNESFEVFRKFQTVIHKESEADAGEKQFNEFLVYTPLKHKEGTGKMTTDFGTYHQQYLLDGKIFAVGVLDVLPRGVLCEYLYYDPDYRFIAPGVITALLEISLTQQFYLQNPEMQYYYMGFYVQSCPKMNYKSRYSASSLLCPETYTYVPIEQCIPKLKASPYSRLAEADVENQETGCTEDDMKRVPVLADQTLMCYETYIALYGNSADNFMKEYIELVGLATALNMHVYIGRRELFTFSPSHSPTANMQTSQQS